jgi:hypothetical protein
MAHQLATWANQTTNQLPPLLGGWAPSATAGDLWRQLDALGDADRLWLHQQYFARLGGRGDEIKFRLALGKIQCRWQKMASTVLVSSFGLGFALGP